MYEIRQRSIVYSKVRLASLLFYHLFEIEVRRKCYQIWRPKNRSELKFHDQLAHTRVNLSFITFIILTCCVYSIVLRRSQVEFEKKLSRYFFAWLL